MSLKLRAGAWHTNKMTYAPSENSDPSLPIKCSAKTLIRLAPCRLIGVPAGCTCHFVVLSCCVSIIIYYGHWQNVFLLFILLLLFFFLWAPPSPSHTKYQAKTTFCKFKLKFNYKFSLCNFVYIHTYIHTYIHIYMHACMHTYIHTYMHVRI